MKALAYRTLKEEIEKLTPHQRKSLLNRLRADGQTGAVLELIESRVSATPVCPHCGHGAVSRWGAASGLSVIAAVPVRPPSMP